MNTAISSWSPLSSCRLTERGQRFPWRGEYRHQEQEHCNLRSASRKPSQLSWRQRSRTHNAEGDRCRDPRLVRPLEVRLLHAQVEQSNDRGQVPCPARNREEVEKCCGSAEAWELISQYSLRKPPPKTTYSTVSPAFRKSALSGVLRFGSTRENTDGRKWSLPAAKMRRAAGCQFRTQK